jgi:hypothetical protein
MTTLRALWMSMALLSLPVAGCAAESGGEGGGGSCEGDKCDDLDLPDGEVPDSPCDGTMVDMSGRGNSKVAGRLHDPLANAVFNSGDGCPETFQDILAKLKTVDNKDCQGTGDGAGQVTRAISETAQITASATSYRLVTSRACGGRDNAGILFSLFGVRAGAAALPKNVEMISFDQSAGVFNYYETDGTTLNFFGNSHDMLKGKGSGDDRRCAGCHVGGGLIMKELRAPWLHWEGDTTTPGVADLIKKHAASLGEQSNGIELEGTVDSANSTWNKERLKFLKGIGDTKEILRPLFCSPEINIASTGPGSLSSIPTNLFIDQRVSNFTFFPVTTADYDELIAANGQMVDGTDKRDTFFPFPFAERSSIDTDYVQQLIDAEMITEEFAKDVAMVDFTRPVFSEDRCALLDLVPSIPAAEIKATKLKDGILANMGTPAAGSPAAELKANLSKQGGQDTLVTAFTDKCTARTPKDFLADVVQIASLNRDQARDRQVMEFPESMPDDNLDIDAGTRLDPATCELTTEFVAVSAAAAAE